MAIRANSDNIETGRDLDKHPKGLYVLFATEMWERFSFYTMVSMFTLYLRDPNDGFAWTAAQASTLYANYMMFVYCSPLIGGWIADRKLGYRRAVMLGGFFFMAGHLLLSVRSMAFVYAALTCLVIGNGFFKPNVSTMVGNLYPDGSHLKDRAYNIFYMGINVGAFLAPLVATLMQKYFGFHPAFAVAAFGMVISVTILWRFKHEPEGTSPTQSSLSFGPTEGLGFVASVVGGLVGFLLRPTAPLINAQLPFDVVITRGGVLRGVEQALVPLAETSFNYLLAGAIVGASIGMILGYFIARSGKTPGSISQVRAEVPSAEQVRNAAAISIDAPLEGVTHEGAHHRRASVMEGVPEWKRIGALVVVFAAVVVFWMVFHQNGTTITYWADENTDWNVRGIISNAINPAWVIILTFPLIGFWKWLDSKGKEPATPTKMVLGMAITSIAFLVFFVAAKTGEATVTGDNIYAFKMSPAWLLGAYGVLTLGELMLSPMGLSLVSKVAPTRFRGMMMGGWFVATGLGNKLTQIAVFWTEWKHSTFWLVLSGAAMVMAVVLLLLLRPLKKAMPGV